MPDFFDVLCRTAQKTVDSGYYGNFVNRDKAHHDRVKLQLSECITKCTCFPLIAEIKVASPTIGALRVGIDARLIAMLMAEGGAVGISVVTEPHFFKGSAELLTRAESGVSVPLLMKDFVVDRLQVEAARDIGASAVLLIQALFDRGYATCTVEEMIDFAHTAGLEVLLETHTDLEFAYSLSTSADFIGINNRDLRTLEVDLATTKSILENVSYDRRAIISESGISKLEDAQFLKECGADALLVGSALMRADDVRHTVETFSRVV